MTVNILQICDGTASFPPLFTGSSSVNGDLLRWDSPCEHFNTSDKASPTCDVLTAGPPQEMQDKRCTCALIPFQVHYWVRNQAPGLAKKYRMTMDVFSDRLSAVGLASVVKSVGGIKKWDGPKPESWANYLFVANYGGTLKSLAAMTRCKDCLFSASVRNCTKYPTRPSQICEGFFPAETTFGDQLDLADLDPLDVLANPAVGQVPGPEESVEKRFRQEDAQVALDLLAKKVFQETLRRPPSKGTADRKLRILCLWRDKGEKVGPKELARILGIEKEKAESAVRALIDTAIKLRKNSKEFRLWLAKVDERFGNPQED
ncbi:hypothetical protein ACFL2Q_02815 [Thermodesulfobacteriota bacterium]